MRFKHIAGTTGSKFGTGGMATKVLAAEMAMSNGTDLIIGYLCSGFGRDVCAIYCISSKGQGT